VVPETANDILIAGLSVQVRVCAGYMLVMMLTSRFLERCRTFVRRDPSTRHLQDPGSSRR